MDTSPSSGLRIAQVFLLEGHFAHRPDALSLPPATPHAEGLVHCQVRFFEPPDRSTAAASVRIQTPDDDQTALYRYAVEMVVVVNAISGEENVLPSEYIRGPAIVALVPFIREVIANLTMRGRFGPVWLNPMNVQRVLLELVPHAAPASSAAAVDAADRERQGTRKTKRKPVRKRNTK